MQVRLKCPACDGTHIFDMPETTINMTCGVTAKTVQCRLGLGGDVKGTLLDEQGREIAPKKKK